jgi:hypothetical protein
MTKKLKPHLPVIAIGLICVLLIVLFIASRAGQATAFDAAEYLSGFGWEISGEPSSVRNVGIPEHFSEAYEDYNELQRSQGFDLSQYRGKSAVMYTFKILNHPAQTNVFANVLVFNGKVIGGDVVSYAVNGFIHGLSANN